MKLFSKDIVVMDVTSRVINAIVGTKKSSSVFCIKSNVQNEHVGFSGDNFIDEETTARIAADTLKAAMLESNSSSKRLFIGVPAEFVAVYPKDVELQLNKNHRIIDDDIDALYKLGNNFDSSGYELVNISPIYYTLNGEEALYNEVRGLVAHRINAGLSYIFASSRFISVFDRVAKQLGFKDIRYVASDWAQCTTLLDDAQRARFGAYVNIGSRSTSVSLFRGDGLLDLKSFNIGGYDIENAVSSVYGVDNRAAVTAKENVCLNLDYQPDEVLVISGGVQVYSSAVKEIVEACLSDIAVSISGVMKEYNDYLPQYLPVYISGDGVLNVRGARNYLALTLKRKLEIVTPKIPGFVTPSDSSRIALLQIAGTLSKFGLIESIKNLFS